MNIDYLKMLKDSGIPTTEEELKAKWDEENAKQGSPISNDSAYSVFWRLISALITQPVIWMIKFMAESVLPNSFVKTATGIYLDVLAWAVHLERKPAVKAQGVVTFTREDVGSPFTVPAGTRIRTATINNSVYELIVEEDTEFLSAAATLDVLCIAADSGTAYNLAPGYYAILAEPIAGIISVSNPADWIIQPGTDTETDDELRERVRNQFGTASDFHTDSVYRSLISSFAGVKADAIYFEHNAPRGPGTANAYVLFDFDAPTAEYLATINNFITDQGHHGHGDDLQVYQLPTQAQDLIVNVWHEPFLSVDEITQLQADVDNYIRAAFRENNSYDPTLTHPYSRFSFSKLGQEVHLQFTNVHSIDFNLADIVSTLWVPVINTMTINMAVAE